MTATAFAKTSATPIAFDKKLGICSGWFCFSKQEGAEYDDEHGDHMPDDELLLAVDKLMAKPSTDRLLDMDHIEKGRGVIATAIALTEDVVKASSPPISTFGTYGVLGTFRPDAALLKSIEAGERFCLSVTGMAHNVEIVKSADGSPVTKGRKRILRGLELTGLGIVKAGAHVNAQVNLIKGAAIDLTAVERNRYRVAKACPAMTTATAGHSHLIADCDEDAGYTSSEAMPGLPDSGWHSHPWIKDEATGAITIGEANGHSHTVTPTDTAETDMPDPTDLAKAQADLTSARAALAKTAGLLAAAVALTPDQAAFAKRLEGDKLEAFLGKSADERAKLAAPIHKSERTGRVFFAGDEALVEIVKDADEQAAKFAKAEAAGEVVAFEKAATATIPHLQGDLATRAAIMKAVGGIADEAVRKNALTALKGADAAVAMVCKTVGVSGNADPVLKSAQDELDGIATEIAKAQNVTFAKASTLALDTPRGRALYDQIETSKRR